MTGPDHDAEPLPRVVPLRNSTNLRDLGGYRAADGRRVRFGRVFRSGSLALLSDADLDAIAALGLRTVCDLRGAHERERAPNRLPPGARAEILPIEPTVGASLRDLLEREEATGEDVHSLLARAYAAYAGEHLPRYRQLFARVLDADALPLLFHCSAGKDRTGFGAALLLTALGVPRDTIVEDYLATNRIWRRETSLLPTTVPAPVREALLSAHRPLLENALDLAMAGHPTVEHFQDGALGLDAARLARLRALLLEDAPD